MNSKSEWKRQVKAWRRRYRNQLPKKRPDFTKVVVGRKCVACSSDKDVHRHHKGNDFFFASILPDEFAARYVQFLDEDIVLLCDRCHNDMHWWYAPIVSEFRTRYHKIDSGDKDSIRLLCIEYMKRCSKTCDEVIEEWIFQRQ